VTPCQVTCHVPARWDAGGCRRASGWRLDPAVLAWARHACGVLELDTDQLDSHAILLRACGLFTLHGGCRVGGCFLVR
jgi:hypothetical protein